MSQPEKTLHIAEITDEIGLLRFRYERYLSDDGAKWVRHGLFTAYNEHGHVISYGNYKHGLEHGIWRDFHDNGQLAAEGLYQHGHRRGDWVFFDRNGNVESESSGISQ